MTDAEKALWKVLRCRQVSGLKFRRQHPVGDYILDFVCLENKLVVEVDGGQHGKRTNYDEIRTENLRTAGFRVLRFWNTEVLHEIEAVRERIWRAVQERQPHSLPGPPLEGRGIRCSPALPLKGREDDGFFRKVSRYPQRLFRNRYKASFPRKRESTRSRTAKSLAFSHIF